jgi:hypothetical protein
MRGMIWALSPLLLVPIASAENVPGTTFTGDVDVYNEPDPDQICAQVITDWRVTLILRPGPGPDIVKLAAEGTTSDVDVTTPADRTATVFVTTSTACPALIEVTGLFVGSAALFGDLGYSLEWVRDGGGEI